MSYFFVSEAMNGWRIEKACAALFPGRTRTQWLDFLQQGKIRSRKGIWAKGDRVTAGDEMIFLEIPPKADEWLPAWTNPSTISVAWESESVLVVDKPPGLPTLPLHMQDAPTAAGALYARFGIASIPASEAGIVNRLDTGTSGLLLAGRTRNAQEKLRHRFASHHIEKNYRALVHGRFPEGVIWLSGRVITTGGPKVRYERYERDEKPCRVGNQLAVSRVICLWTGSQYSLVEVTTRFGRRHQVRIQLADAGFPLFNDHVYGTYDGWSENEHFLWACRVTFADPESDTLHTVSSCRLPSHWLELARKLGFETKLGFVEAFES